jgi:Fur family transcriptional regulator, stress-responsive regulator
MLRGLALRVTRPRVAVLSAVHDHPHAATEPIIGVVREDLGEMSYQAGYDVLRALTATGLVRRFQPTGSLARYEARVGDNHHVAGRSCGAFADVDRAVGYTACLAAVDDSGYEIDEVEVIYRGPMSRVCRGNFCRVRRLIAGTQRSTPAEQYPLGREQSTSRATSHQDETARQEMDRRV